MKCHSPRRTLLLFPLYCSPEPPSKLGFFSAPPFFLPDCGGHVCRWFHNITSSVHFCKIEATPHRKLFSIFNPAGAVVIEDKTHMAIRLLDSNVGQGPWQNAHASEVQNISHARCICRLPHLSLRLSRSGGAARGGACHQLAITSAIGRSISPAEVCYTPIRPRKVVWEAFTESFAEAFGNGGVRGWGH